MQPLTSTLRHVALAALVAAVVLDPTTEARVRPFQRAGLRIRNVRVIHGDGRVTPSATVLLRGDTIVSIRPAGMTGLPPDETEPATDIDGAGRSLLPGLIDAHVHTEPWTFGVFLSFGVTTVRALHNTGDVVFPLAGNEAPGRPQGNRI